MAVSRELTRNEYYEIKKIAYKAATDNKLDIYKCYNLTLFYYLAQFGGLPINTLFPEDRKSVTLLYKPPFTSYIHYRTEIMYSDDIYVKAIKDAEIDLNGGDDPRCPW